MKYLPIGTVTSRSISSSYRTYPWIMCRFDLSCFFLIFQIRGTVILRIWFQVLFCALWAAGLVYLQQRLTNWRIHIEPLTLSVPSIINGLLLVFRTNTAYDRFWEGRKLWSDLIWNVRTLARNFWVYVDDKKDSTILLEKISVVNLLAAFTYSTKHYLREEYSYDEEDIKEFIGHLPRMFNPTSTNGDRDNRLSVTPPEVIKRRQKAHKDRMKANAKYKPEKKEAKVNDKKRSLFYEAFEYTETNIPLELTYFITSYTMSLKARDLVDSPFCRVTDTAVSNLVKCLNGLERVRQTPIPLAYSVHLHHVTWIIVLILPLQWIQDIGWMTVAAEALASFALLGVLSIAREIENPFGYDFNDLNMDDYCHTLHKELMSLIAKPLPQPESWIYSEKNHPIVTDFDLTAAKLSNMDYEDFVRLLNDGKDHNFGVSNTSLYSGHRSGRGEGDHKV